MRPRTGSDANAYRDASLLDEWTEVFKRSAGERGHIGRADLQACLKIRDDYLAGRIFEIFDADSSGTIELGEFLSALSELLLGGRDAKLDFAFRLHDRDHSGAIDRSELMLLVSGALSESELEFSGAQTDLLVDAVFKKADANGDGEISLAEFRETLQAYPQLYEQMTLSAASWLAPTKGRKKRRRKSRSQQSMRYAQITSSAVIFVVLYGLANAALFVNAMVNYSDHNVFVMIARGCGACLNFNGALILLPMMRHFATWLRKSVFYAVVPVDHAISFHKLVGHVMFALSVVHTVAHVANYSTLEQPILASLFGTWAGLTGVLLLAVFAVMWFFSRSSVRRKGAFEHFFYTHLAFVAWFLLALLHGPVFWQWASLPLVGYGVERLWRLYQGKDPSYIVQSEVLPGDVTHLQLNRPQGFLYQPGDYVFVLIPELSKFEWHPFTISSAPEQPDVISLHVRALGNWTKALLRMAQTRSAANVLTPVEVYLDGPYGTPSTKVFESKHAVLIGAGIGVTPFASILQSIVRRRAAGELAHMQKVYFYWINRGQYSFAWFTELLAEIESSDVSELVDVNIYLSSAKMDLKSATLNIAMDLSHAETGRDLITGLHLRTQMGRPDFGEIFGGIAERHSGQPVDVFFCGPAGLSRNLKREAEKCGFSYRKENF